MSSCRTTLNSLFKAGLKKSISLSFRITLRWKRLVFLQNSTSFVAWTAHFLQIFCRFCITFSFFYKMDTSLAKLSAIWFHLIVKRVCLRTPINKRLCVFIFLFNLRVLNIFLQFFQSGVSIVFDFFPKAHLPRDVLVRGGGFEQQPRKLLPSV